MSPARQNSLLLVALGVLMMAAVFTGGPATAQRPSQTPASTVKPSAPIDKASALSVRASAPAPHSRDVIEESRFPVRVPDSLKLDEVERARFRVIAEHISQFSDVPDRRLQFFSAYEATLNSKIIGWAGNIMEIEDSPGGWLVKVRVGPRFTEDFVYPMTTKKYCEHFLVLPDGSVTYLESSAPGGGAGQPPVVLGTRF